MSYLPLEIWQEILEQSKFLTQIRFRQICKFLRNTKIYDFCDNISGYYKNISGEILQNYPFIKKLKLINNTRIIRFNNLKKLIAVLINNNYLLNSSIKFLDLTELNVTGQIFITNIDCLTNLRILSAGSICGISKINNLNLVKLNIQNNFKIKKVNHLTNLKSLSIGYLYNIKNNFIKGLNLIELDASGCWGITDVSTLTSLQILKANYSGIDDYGIRGLNLIKLSILGNSRIKNISKLSKLKEINIDDECYVDENYLKKLGINVINH